MVKTRTWVIILLPALLLSAIASWILLTGQAAGTVANFYVEGVCVESIDLSAVSGRYSFVVEGVYGSNQITVEQGRVCVSGADCPDQTCVHQGWIGNGVAPIVCLPNRLVIRIERAAEQSDDIDSVTK